jgi:hypothetical protein
MTVPGVQEIRVTSMAMPLAVTAGSLVQGLGNGSGHVSLGSQTGLVEVVLSRFLCSRPTAFRSGLGRPWTMTTGTPIVGSDCTRSMTASSDSSASWVADTPRRVRTTSPGE